MTEYLAVFRCSGVPTTLEAGPSKEAVRERILRDWGEADGLEILTEEEARNRFPVQTNGGDHDQGSHFDP